MFFQYWNSVSPKQPPIENGCLERRGFLKWAQNTACTFLHKALRVDSSNTVNLSFSFDMFDSASVECKIPHIYIYPFTDFL